MSWPGAWRGGGPFPGHLRPEHGELDGKDGYYYYNAALEPGHTTEPLFTAVHFAKTMSNMYQESRAILQVNAFATQTAHNGASALEAAGWPEA